MPNALVWFRNDLRLDDQPALQAALDEGLVPICVYIHAPDEEGNWAPGPASNAWRHRSLLALDADLRAHGSRLRCFVGPSSATLEAVAAGCDAVAVFWNRRYEPAIEARDTRIKKTLRRHGMRAHSFNSALLSEPWALQTKQGTPYKVFTPYWRAAVVQGMHTPTRDAPETLEDTAQGPDGVSIEALHLAPARQWDDGFWDRFTPGEAGAREALEVFVDGAVHGYGEGRDRPDRAGTSRLSPHLHFGEIAPWRAVKALEANRNAANAADIDAFVRQLGWRDFAHHLLHHFPASTDADLNPRFARFPWASHPPTMLTAWQQGMTGVPIVDAGMRELWHTGWMHNRVRLVAGSYLCKHLRLHWLHGARWFWETLVDSDLANNTLGWQWIGGTGADASPYFRIFNPVTQSQRFDPDGAYIARWLPELAALPAALRHAPWTDPARLARVAPAYPQRPIVDLAEGRDAALAAYQRSR